MKVTGVVAPPGALASATARPPVGAFVRAFVGALVAEGVESSDVGRNESLVVPAVVAGAAASGTREGAAASRSSVARTATETRGASSRLSRWFRRPAPFP
ncbi:hypothetical protein GCM10009817_38590 [Terrabacter lapilli]|uniref:Uncharacterized protein n=1 Tax=Terrabacter lapilli TaxID=436231 RepID=A0ABN2SU98_9MICO